MDWFDPHFEFRFPLIGQIEQRGITLSLRSALEPWHVMGEEGSAGGTVRRSGKPRGFREAGRLTKQPQPGLDSVGGEAYVPRHPGPRRRIESSSRIEL
jgi:hypothetical protein